jgi:hypothetical protein
MIRNAQGRLSHSSPYTSATQSRAGRWFGGEPSFGPRILCVSLFYVIDTGSTRSGARNEPGDCLSTLHPCSALAMPIYPVHNWGCDSVTDDRWILFTDDKMITLYQSGVEWIHLRKNWRDREGGGELGRGISQDVQLSDCVCGPQV